MPRQTSNRRYVIVYLPDELFKEVEDQARKLYTSKSQVVRDLVLEALAWRKQRGNP